MKNYKKLLGMLLVVALTMTMFPATALAYSTGGYGDISAGDSKDFDLGTYWAADYYAFTPSTTGYYTFYSHSKSNGDPYFFLTSKSNAGTVANNLASIGSQNNTARSYSLAYDDDTNGSGNFYVKYWCTKGTTYYCFLTKYNTSRTTASFTVQGPYYNYATLNNQSATSAGTTGYYNDTGYQGLLRIWTSTDSTSNTTTITVPTKTGYTFGGYYTGTKGTGTQYVSPSGVIKSSTYSGTLYAYWIPGNYTISLNKQSGSGGTSTISVAYGGLIPATITPPTRGGYTFGGYYTSTGGGGAQYYNAAGTRVYTSAWASASGTTLYAKWTNDSYTLTLNNQGVANGAVSLTYGQKIPSPITVPVRTGYTFKGYSTELNGTGTQYYDENGTRTFQGTWSQKSGLTVYAWWERVESTLTVKPNGGTWNGDTGDKQFTEVGTTIKNIPDPTKGYQPFLGWEKTGNTGTLANGMFTFGHENVTLTAKWGATPQTAFTNKGSLNAASKDATASDLGEVFNHIVTDPDKGVTAEELDKGSINLALIVDDADEMTQGAADINIASRGADAAFFLDISVEKTVNGGAPVKLLEIPVPIEVRIPLPVEHQDKLGYSVYRYHNGAVEQLSSNQSMVEYFEVNTSAQQIVIYTRKFSTYAVIVHEFTITGHSQNDPLEGRYTTPGSEPGWNVQGKVTGGGGGKYKIDIEWGAMTFDYSIASSWNPDTHAYDGPKIYAWLPSSYFQNGNNKITAYNHSNVDVEVTFNAVSTLGGVTMTVYEQNNDEENTPLARDMLIEKVPHEGASVIHSRDAYLRLTGTPDNVSNVDGAYEKAGVITVTVAAKPENGTTPVGKNP